MAQAGGTFTEDQVRAALHPVPTNLRQILGALCYHGLVVQEADEESYRVAGQMFRDWFDINGDQVSEGSPPAVASPATTPAVLRRRLQRLDAVEFESLCLDHFPEVYNKFTRGLQREEKHNLLLDYCRSNPAETDRLDEIITMPAREEKQGLPSLPPAKPTIDSGGGPVIMGDVYVKDGDLVGRDKHT